jgi:hypothetical protein
MTDASRAKSPESCAAVQLQGHPSLALANGVYTDLEIAVLEHE